MKTTLASFPKADAVDPSSEPVGTLMLAFDGELPTHAVAIAGHREYWRDFYREHALRFVSLLVKHAPGGLVDAILVALLDHQACVLRRSL